MSNNERKRLDPRVLRSRQLLRDALIDLVSERGYQALTVQDITDYATLNRATFYLHYRDKNDLLMDAFETMMLSAAPVPPENPIALPMGKESIVPVFEHVAQHAAFYKVMLAEENVPAFAARARSFVEEVGLKWFTHLRADRLEALVSVDLALQFVGAAYLGAIVWWLENGMPYSPEQMAEQLMRLTTLGVHRSMGLESPPE